VTRPPVEVRRGGTDDLEELLLLWAQARQEPGRNGRTSGSVTTEQIRPRLRETLSGSETHVLVARYEGVSAGYAVLRLAPALAVLDGPALHIDHLYVTPQSRRRGVARAMLSAATAIAERHGADQVLAGAPPSAKESHRFLARLGFSPLVMRRAVSTATLRRRLAGEGQRRGLEDLLSRRRSLRARGLRPSWHGAAPADVDPDAADVPAEDPADEALNLPCEQPANQVDPLPVEGPPVEGLQVDLETMPGTASDVDSAPVPLVGDRRRARA
jgi:ribosomal protein S18 acetylase RimI-like enzyme